MDHYSVFNKRKMAKPNHFAASTDLEHKFALTKKVYCSRPNLEEQSHICPRCNRMFHLQSHRRSFDLQPARAATMAAAVP